MAFSSQTRKLYDGQVTLHFNPNSRNRYQLEDGTAPVGVTTVLDKVMGKDLKGWAVAEVLKALGATLKFEKSEFIWHLDEPLYIDEEKLRWASKAYVRRSDTGKSIGSEVHEWIENYLNSIEQPGPSRPALAACLAFARWFDETHPTVLATEQIVYSKDFNYAGTFDALLEIDGKKVLCDIKTTNSSREAPKGIYAEYFLQLGAYSVAYCEATGEKIDDLMVINAGKDGKLSTLRASELDLSIIDCELNWLYVLHIYKFLEPLKKLIKEKE